MANVGKGRSEREARERARLYQARQDFQNGLARRRRRDNLVAGIVGGLLLAGVIAVQTAYFVAGPGAPEPSPTPTPTTSISTPGPTPTPSTTPSPTPTVSPTP
ncbi:dioxygenase [Microbacterium sp. NPDC057407]|uniref:dioxygenase n=1 Tax=Microbacterium sp. NPDC057407 TaxID=3346120 RepID=UPI00366BA424